MVRSSETRLDHNEEKVMSEEGRRGQRRSGLAVSVTMSVHTRSSNFGREPDCLRIGAVARQAWFC